MQGTSYPLHSRLRWIPDAPLIGVLFVVALVAFANSIGNGFVFDDVFIIENNPRLESPWDLPVFFGTDYWGEGATGRLYRPLTLWSFALDRAVFGSGAFGVHLVNVIANAVLAAVTYVFLFILTTDRRLSFIAALLYCIHPVHSEVVANGVGRSELISALAMFIAFGFHLVSARTAPEASRTMRATYRVAAAGFYLVALLSKESAVLLPGLLFLFDWLVLARGRLWPAVRGLRAYLVYAAPLLVFLTLRWQVVGLGPVDVHVSVASLTALERSLMGFEVMGQYLGQLTFPLWLCSDYTDFRLVDPPSVFDVGVLIGATSIASLLASIVWLMRAGHRLPAFGIAWILFALLPFSNIFIPIGTVRADRLLFVPSLGMCLVLAWGLIRLSQWRRELAWIVLAALIGFYGWRAISRNADWYSQDTLAIADIERNPGNPLGWLFVGAAYARGGDDTAALVAYERAIDLYESRAGFYTSARMSYAATLRRRGEMGAAIAQYRLLLEHEPNNYRSLSNLGEVLMIDAETRDEAIGLLRRSIESKPGEIASRGNLAQALRLAGRREEAARVIEDALAVSDRDAQLWRLYAQVLRELGRKRDAALAIDRAKRIEIAR